jgi:stage IV sporulation protein FB
VNLKVHYLFLLWLVALSTLGQLLYAFVLLISVVFHELGHILVAANLGIRTTEVELMPFGGVARFNRILGSDPAREAAVSLAGPTNSLVLLMVGLLFSRYGWGITLMEANVLLLFVNMLPVLPLDGGRILRSHLIQSEGLQRGSALLLKRTVYGAYLLLCLSIIAAASGVFSPNAVVLALFVVYSARQERKMLPYMVMNHVSSMPGVLREKKLLPVRTLAVYSDTPLKAALDKLVPDHYHIFVVIGSDRHERLVTEDMFLSALTGDRYDKTFGEITKYP